MQDRRTVHRDRTYLGAQVAYNNRCSTMDCLVRNVSANGAKIAFSEVALIPSEFDVLVPKKGESRRARIVWRAEKEIGVTFLQSAGNAVISIESARRIRQLEADRDALAKRLAQINEHG